jgi:hypothetical protein
MCGAMVYERAESVAVDAAARIDRTHARPVFSMFSPTT